MTFSEAIWYLKSGQRIARQGWNGKGMWIYEQKCSILKIENCRNPILKDYMMKEGLSEIKLNHHIDMKCADGSIVVGWLASQTDMLADDWVVIGDLKNCCTEINSDNCGEDCACNKPEEPEIEDEPTSESEQEQTPETDGE